MAKHKTGLHKEISSIFDGVPMPKKDTSRPPASPAVAERKGHLPPTPGVRFPTVPPKPPQPAQPPPKPAEPKVSKADASIKTRRQSQWQQALEQVKGKFFALKPNINTTRQMITVVLIPILAIGLIFALVNVFNMSSRPNSRAEGSDLPPQIANVGKEIDWQIPPLYPTGLRDPMRFGPRGSGRFQTGEIIVRGILYSEDKPSAVIGTEIAYEGDIFGEVTIKKINKDSVEFEKDGKIWTQKVVQ